MTISSIFSDVYIKRRIFLSCFSCLFGLFTYLSFQQCLQSFYSSSGIITSKTQKERGYYYLIIGIILSGVGAFLGLFVQILETNGIISIRPTSIYITTTEIKVKSKDSIPEHQ